MCLRLFHLCAVISKEVWSVFLCWYCVEVKNSVIVTTLLGINFIWWWDSVNPFSRQSSSAPVNLCDAGPQPVTQPPLGPLTFLGLSFSQLPLFSRCSVQKNWRQPWRCHCSAWVVATTTTWWESCELSSKSSVMLGFMTIVPRGRKEGSRQP